MDVFEAKALFFTAHLGPGLVLLDAHDELFDQSFAASEISRILGDLHQ